MTKDQLTHALRDAEGMLAYHISLAHYDMMAARRAIRQYPRCDLFVRDLERASQVHDRMKRLSWLEPARLRDVRERAAKFVRSDLETSRKLRPRAFPAAAPLALAA